MTINNGPDDLQKGGGKDQRPYATLDLKAEPVSSGETKTGADASTEKTTEPSDAGPRNEAPVRANPILSIATHIGAGALGGLLALAIGYFAMDHEPGSSGQEEVAALRSDLAKTSAKVAELDGKLREAAQKAAASAGANVDTGGLQKQLSAMSDRIDHMEARPGGVAVSQESIKQAIDPIATRISELDARVTKLAKAQNEMQTNSKAAALAVALYNLRRAANDGLPFAEELKSIAAMSPVPLDLATLESLRDKGVPSLKQLKTDFESAANQAIDIENQPADNSFTSELWSKVKSFIRIRRKGDVPGDTTRAILARAEYQLNAGNLKMAASEIEHLQGPAAAAMTSWQSELKAKIAADEALASVESKLLTALGSSEDAGKRGG